MTRRARPSLRVAAAGALVALAAAGCAGEGAPGTDSGPPVAGTGSPSDGSGTAVAATAADWASAPVEPFSGALRLGDGSSPSVTVVALSSGREATEGIDYTVLSRTAPTSSTSSVVALALDADGRLFAARVPDDQYDSGAWLEEPSDVGTTDGTRFTAWPSSETAFDDPHPRQVYAASVDGSWAAWAETESIQAGVSHWRIFAGDGGDPRLVARAEDVGSTVVDLPSSGDARPLVRDGRVYWAAAVPLTEGDEPVVGAQVMSRSADAHDEAVVEAAGASQPAVGAGGLYVARTPRDDPTIADGTFTVERADRGATSPVLTFAGNLGTTVRSLVASGDRLALVVAAAGETGGQVVVLDVPTGAVTTVPLLTSGREVDVALCGDRLVWTSANGSTGVTDNASIGVLDLATGELARVIEADNFAGVDCAGDLVEWTTIELTDGRGVPVVVRWSER